MSTRRPRLLPAALVASGLVVATAFGVLAATAGPDQPTVQSCGAGREWVTVHPVVNLVSDWRPATLNSSPALSGCLDTRPLVPARHRSPADARG